MKTYDVITQPYSTGQLQGAFLNWLVTAYRLEDNAVLSKCFVTRWGAERWARKKTLDRYFARYVDEAVASV